MPNIDRNVNSFMRSRAQSYGSYEALREKYQLEPEELDPYLVDNPPSVNERLMLAGLAVINLYSVERGKDSRDVESVKVKTSTKSDRAAEFLGRATDGLREHAKDKDRHLRVSMNRFVYEFMTEPSRVITTYALDHKASFASIAAGVILPYLYTYGRVSDLQNPVSSQQRVLDRVATYFKRKMGFNLGQTESIQGSTVTVLRINDSQRVREALLAIPEVAQLPVAKLFKAA